MQSSGKTKSVWKRVRRGLLLALVIKLGIVWFLLSLWWQARPTITYRAFDLYRQQYVENLPEHRAWDPIHELARAHWLRPPESSALFERFPPERGWPTYAEGIEFAGKRTEQLAIIRNAAMRPVLGYDYADQAAWAPEQTLANDTKFHGAIRNAIRLLMMDTHAADDQGDVERITANIEAILGLGRVSSQSPSLKVAMMGSGASASALRELALLSDRAWGSMSNDQLMRLERAFASMPRIEGDAILVANQRLIDDHMQRLFTDDGSGDGFICEKGVEYLADVNQIPEKKRRELFRYMMLLNIRTIGRREASAIANDAMAAARAWASLPVWERGALEYKTPSKAAALELALLPVLVAIKTIDSQASLFGSASLRSDAGRMVIAAHRFRREHGAWPATIQALEPMLGSLPLDAFTGRPLQFSIRDDRPFVYSVGNDRDDDGGRSLPARDGYKAALWKPLGDPDIVDADHVLFPNAE